MTSPLHDAAWLASLRIHPETSHQLVGELLTAAGSKLTMYWLDQLIQWGPRTGIPGLFTLYDVRVFSRQHQALIEKRLAEVYPTSFLTELAVANTFSIVANTAADLFYLRHNPKLGAQQRFRRARLAVWLSVAKMHQLNPSQFVAGRAFDAARYRPFTPFIS